MDFLQIGLIALGLSMDAFAVSMCKGLSMKHLNWRHAFLIAFVFGAFQALMPLAGWFLGTRFEKYILRLDHWIAFVLLAYIGGKMLWDAIRSPDDAAISRTESHLNLKELLILALATSIDALAAGITFAVLKTPILPSVLIIGSVTLTLCITGIAIGYRFGSKYERAAQILGGSVLIGIGTKILLEHLGILSFPF
ncbi:MAG: manganese efflux pump [Clostridiales bacterium]|nr:manganese efflux pump [Clostridiales bacterium]